MKKSTLFLILIFCCAPVATGFAQGVDVLARYQLQGVVLGVLLQYPGFPEAGEVGRGAPVQDGTARGAQREVEVERYAE